MVINFASRSASRMIRSKALRRISPRSRGFFAAQAGNAALAASTAALASSTVALATEAILFSVAGSITSKRPSSEALRHLPPIHRSVGTLASRFSYMTGFPWQVSLARVLGRFPLLHGALHTLDDAIHRRQRDVLQDVGGRQRNVRRRDPHRWPVEIVKRLVRNDRHDLGAPAAQPRVLLDRKQAMRA